MKEEIKNHILAALYIVVAGILIGFVGDTLVKLILAFAIFAIGFYYNKIRSKVIPDGN